jgi:hypothetical protein
MNEENTCIYGEFCSAIKKNKWIELGNIILNEVSQVQKYKGCIFSPICGRQTQYKCKHYHIYIYIYIYMCISIYIYIEREREHLSKSGTLIGDKGRKKKKRMIESQ